MTALRRVSLVAWLGALALGGVLAPTVAMAGSDASRLHDARGHYEQAVAHYNLDEFAPALAEFREAYRLKPDPSFLFNIAQCHRKLGEPDAALDYYRKYLRNLPDAPNRADVERMIAELRAQKANAAALAATPPPAPAPVLETAPVVLAPAPAPVAPAPTADALLVTPPPEARTPVYKRWWFWTAVGAVVAGAIVVGYAASRPAPQPYAGSLGPAIEVR